MSYYAHLCSYRNVWPDVIYCCLVSLLVMEFVLCAEHGEGYFWKNFQGGGKPMFCEMEGGHRLELKLFSENWLKLRGGGGGGGGGKTIFRGGGG